MNKTFQPKKEEIKRKWHLIDLQGKILGRAATEIAQLLIGKHKINYAPHVDVGDYVIVINAEKFMVSGRKMQQKTYWRHTGYMGGLKEDTLEEMLKSKPEKVIAFAVRNMLPKNKLRKGRMKRLKVFTGDKHPYEDKLK